MQYVHSREGLIESLRGNLLKTYKRRKLKHVTDAASDVDLNADDMDIDNDDDNGDGPVLFPLPRPEPDAAEASTTVPGDSDQLVSETESKDAVPEDGDVSLSLTELQQRKLELLQALEESADSPATNSPAENIVVLDTADDTKPITASDVKEITESEPVEVSELSQSDEATTTPDEVTPNAEKAANDSQKPNDIEEANGPSPNVVEATPDNQKAETEQTDDSDSDNGQMDAPSTPMHSTLGRSRMSVSGTPLLQQVSPFSELPSSEKWSIGVCDVIDFENLPDATGTYKRLSGLIRRVRTVVKKINDENDAEDDNDNCS